MRTAVAYTPHTGNPGIVPPWLQGGTRPTTPPPVGTTPARHGAPDPLADLLGTLAARTGAIDVAREQVRLEETVARIQASFGALGIRESEGNDPVTARFNPRYPNASYAPNGVPSKGVPVDSITVGVDPRSMRPYTEADDVVAHELAHRVIDHMTTLDMSPFSEDVAVHESLADTFAALVDDDDWVIGDQLVSPVRVMDDPEQLGHPDHVNDLDRVFAPDSEFMHPVKLANGDVVRDPMTDEPVLVPDWHVIAGIPNKAATLIGNELGREKLGEIYLKAVREHVNPGEEIEGLASAVMQSAEELYGADSRESQVTQAAWDAVGMLELVRPQG